MGRVTARNAIAAYFTNANIQYVGTVYPARPVIAVGQAYTQTLEGMAVQASPNGSSAILVVNIPRDVRRRRADTGRGAVNDQHVHEVSIEIWFTSVGGQSNGVQAQLDYDGIVDAMDVLIREDATFGGKLWSVGEYTAGIDHTMNEPRTDPNSQRIFIFGLMKFDAMEWVAGSNV